jgi:hypothetical protein
VGAPASAASSTRSCSSSQQQTCGGSMGGALRWAGWAGWREQGAAARQGVLQGVL